MSLKKVDGSICQTKAETRAALSDGLGATFDKIASFDASIIDQIPQRPVLAHLDKAPTSLELITAIKKMKVNKSPGEDGVPAEVYKAIVEHESLFGSFKDIVDEMWKSGSYKESCEAAIVPAVIDLSDYSQIPRDWPISFQTRNPYKSKYHQYMYECYKGCKTIDAVLESLIEGKINDPKIELERLLKRDLLAGYMEVSNSCIPKQHVVLGAMANDDGGIIYTPWKFARVILLAKKGDLGLLKNWRPICLLDIASKILSSVVVAKLNAVYEDVGMDPQCGFRSGRGTTDGIFNIVIALQKRKEHDLETYGLFIDLIKAFDSISREALWLILRRYGIPDHMLNIIIRLHSEAKIMIALPGGDENDEDIIVNSTIGVRQGSNEGPVLFLFFMLAVFDTLEWPDSITEPMFFSHKNGDLKMNGRSEVGKVEYKLSESLFADDCGLLFQSRAELKTGTAYFYSHLKRLGLNMHVGRPGDTAMPKTVAIFFPGRTGDQVGEQGRLEFTDINDINDSCYIEFTDHIKYLGTIIHCSLSSEPEVKARIAAASKAYGAISKCLLRNKHLNLMDKGRLFKSLVLSILLYGSECWTMTTVLHRLLKSFFNRCVRRMTRITNWRTTKCQKITSAELAGRVGLKSFDDYYVQRLMCWAGKLARMPMSRLTRRMLYAEVYHPRPKGHISSWLRSLKVTLKATLGDDWERWKTAAEDAPLWASFVIRYKFFSSKPPPLPPPVEPVPIRQSQLNPNAVCYFLQDSYACYYGSTPLVSSYACYFGAPLVSC
jgi:hypothetical protein